MMIWRGEWGLEELSGGAWGYEGFRLLFGEGGSGAELFIYYFGSGGSDGSDGGRVACVWLPLGRLMNLCCVWIFSKILANENQFCGFRKD